MTEIARRTFYSGEVQGVGFRARTQRIALAFPITGYVRNLPDGRVELVTQGTSSAVEEFLKAVRTQMQVHIETVEEENTSLERRENFTIQR